MNLLSGPAIRRAFVARHAHDACRVRGVVGRVAGWVDDRVVVCASWFRSKEAHCDALRAITT